MNAVLALWGSILVGSCAQILLKRGLNHRPAHSGGGVRLGWWLGLLRSPWMWAWVVSFTVATALWLLALSRIQISYAYPLLSASYVLVALLSRLVLKESIRWHRWLAIVVICAGVMLVAGG